MIVDSSQVNFNHAIGGDDGDGGLAGNPHDCDAHGGGIFVGSAEVPENLSTVTSTPTTLGAVSLNKSTVDCNEAKAGDGGTLGGFGGEADGGGIYAEGAVWASKTSVSNNVACGGDGATGLGFPVGGDNPIPGGDGGNALGGGIFNLSFVMLPTTSPVAAVPDVTLINCVVNFNKAIGGDGGDGADGSDGGSGGDATGGIYTGGSVLAKTSDVSCNSAIGGKGARGAMARPLASMAA